MHQQLYSNPRRTRDLFAVQVSNIFFKHLHKPPNTRVNKQDAYSKITPISTKPSHSLAVVACEIINSQIGNVHLSGIISWQIMFTTAYVSNSVCVHIFLFFILHRLQSSQWRWRRCVLLETGEKRAVCWRMRLKKVRVTFDPWHPSAHTDWTKLTIIFEGPLIISFLMASCSCLMLILFCYFIALCVTAVNPQR